MNEFCDICTPKYNCTKTAKAKKQKTSNQSNSTELIKLGGDSTRNGGSDDRNDRDDSLDIRNVKKASIYTGVLCIKCKNKSKKDLCDK